MKNFFKKLFGLTRQYDVPTGHTWSRQSMSKQKRVQEAAVTNEEIDRVIANAQAFTDAYDSRKFHGR